MRPVVVPAGTAKVVLEGEESVRSVQTRCLPRHGNHASLRTTGGHVLRIYFQRSFGRARVSARWWLHRIEESALEPDAGMSARALKLAMRGRRGVMSGIGTH